MCVLQRCNVSKLFNLAVYTVDGRATASYLHCLLVSRWHMSRQTWGLQLRSRRCQGTTSEPCVFHSFMCSTCRAFHGRSSVQSLLTPSNVMPQLKGYILPALTTLPKMNFGVETLCYTIIFRASWARLPTGFKRHSLFGVRLTTYFLGT